MKVPLLNFERGLGSQLPESQGPGSTFTPCLVFMWNSALQEKFTLVLIAGFRSGSAGLILGYTEHPPLKPINPANIVGTPLLIKGEGVGPSKNWVTWEVQNFLLERGDKSEKWQGVDVEMGEVDTFLLPYSSITFTVGVGKVRFPLLLFRIFSLLS